MRFFSNIRRFLGRGLNTLKTYGKRAVSEVKIDNVDKTALPPQVAEKLNRYGDMNISDVKVCRVPIQGAINKLFNFLTGGKWDSIKQQVGYDNLFHLFMTFKIGNTEMILEKNQLVRLSEYPPSNRGECININLPTITLNTLIKNTIARMGIENFNRYDPFNNNCQNFIMNVLDANGTMNPEIHNFILQPVDALVKKLPGFVATIAKGLTDIAVYIDNRLQKSISNVDGRQEESTANN